MAEQNNSLQNLVSAVCNAVQELKDVKGSTAKSIQTFLECNSPSSPTPQEVQAALKKAVEEDALHLDGLRYKYNTDCGCGSRHGHKRRRRSRSRSRRRSGRRRKSGRSLCKPRNKSRCRKRSRPRRRACRRKCTRMWKPKKSSRRRHRRGRCHEEAKDSNQTQIKVEAQP